MARLRVLSGAGSTPRFAAGILLAAALVPAFPGAAALPPPEPRRVAAFFWHDSPNDEAALEGFRRGLRDARLAWAVDVSRAGGDEARGRALLRRAREGGADLVLALGTRAALLAREDVRDRPVLFTAVTNPVASGVVASWDGSGTNLAGNSNWLSGRDLVRVFREAVPGLARLGVALDPANPVSRAEAAEVEEVLRRFHPDVSLVRAEAPDAAALGPAAARLRDSGVQAIWVPIDNLVYGNLPALAAAADPAGIPLLTSAEPAAREAAVVGLVPDYRLLGRQAAEMARRVLVEGADPGRLPVGRLRTFRTVVNLRAASRARARVPLALLGVADEVLR